MSVDSRKWVALTFISIAALMVALDSATLNIALPSAQAELGFSDASRQWIYTAGLAAVGLLLLGGRFADYYGRKKVLMTGLVGVIAASLLAGTANGLLMLTSARVLYGLSAAMLAPAALSLLVVTFTDTHARGKAFAIYFGVIASGAAVGQVLSGALVEYVGWRACLLVNVPIGVLALVGAWRSLPATPSTAPTGTDFAGVLLSTTGLLALAYGTSGVFEHGWSSPFVIVPITAAVVLLAGFWRMQFRVTHPLLPPRLLLDRTRGGAYLALALVAGGVHGLSMLLSYYFQAVLDYSPLQAGTAFLPVSVCAWLGSVLAGRLTSLVAPRIVLVPALLAAAAGVLLFTRLEVGGSFLTQVLPTEILLGLGMGLIFVTAIATATRGVDGSDSGVAAAMVNTAQDGFGPIGVALLSSIAAAATASYETAGSPQSLVHGFTTAAGWAAGMIVVAALCVAFMVTAPAPTSHRAPVGSPEKSPR